jgi:hypothetical protein
MLSTIKRVTARNRTAESTTTKPLAHKVATTGCLAPEVLTVRVLTVKVRTVCHVMFSCARVRVCCMSVVGFLSP